MANFAVRVVRGSGWDPARPIREQDGWDEHARFMDALVEDGFVLIGGPIGDDGALHLVAARDEDEIRARLTHDPWAGSGQLRVATVEPWLIWLDGLSGDPAVQPSRPG